MTTARTPQPVCSDHSHITGPQCPYRAEFIEQWLRSLPPESKRAIAVFNACQLCGWPKLETVADAVSNHCRALVEELAPSRCNCDPFDIKTDAILRQLDDQDHTARLPKQRTNETSFVTGNATVDRLLSDATPETLMAALFCLHIAKVDPELAGTMERELEGQAEAFREGDWPAGADLEAEILPTSHWLVMTEQLESQPSQT